MVTRPFSIQSLLPGVPLKASARQLRRNSEGFGVTNLGIDTKVKGSSGGLKNPDDSKINCLLIKLSNARITGQYENPALLNFYSARQWMIERAQSVVTSFLSLPFLSLFR
jgi:hypothetical protein